MGGRTAVGASVALALLIGACSDPVAPPTQLTVSPSPVTLGLGERTTLTASLRDEDGSPVIDLVTWSSSDPSVASVNAGLVTALQPGTAEITATAAGLTASASVTVEDRTAPTVTILTPVAGATVEGTVSVAARVTDNHQVSSVSLLLNGVEVDTEVASGGTTVTATLQWDSDGTDMGVQVLTVEATDASGNIGASTVDVLVEEAEDPPFVLSISGVVNSSGRNSSINLDECGWTITATASGGAERSMAEWLSGQREVRNLHGVVTRTDTLDASALLDMFGSSHISTGETQSETRTDREGQPFDLLYTFRAQLPDGTKRSIDVFLNCYD